MSNALTKAETKVKASEYETSDEYNKVLVPTYVSCLKDEMAAYTLIGQNRLREIIDNNKNADYLLWVGSQVRIKRPEFEKYLSQIHHV